MSKFTAAIRRRSRFVHWAVYMILGFMLWDAWLYMPRWPAVLFTAYAILHVLYLHLITWSARTSEEMWGWYHEHSNEQMAWMRSRMKQVRNEIEEWKKMHGDGEGWKQP